MLLLEDAAGRAALMDFLRAGYSEHHLAFWEEVVHRYRALPAEDQAARDSMAREMWQRYGKNGSASQINITEPQRLRVQTALERIGQPLPDGGAADASAPAPPASGGAGGVYGAPPDLFDESAAYCLELIKGNYFFPFQSSKQYLQYKAEKAQREHLEQQRKQEQKEKKSNACVIL